MATQHSQYGHASDINRLESSAVLNMDADNVGLVTARTKQSHSGPRILDRFTAYLPARLRRFLPILVIGAIYTVIGVFFLVNYSAFLHLLQELSVWLNDHGLGGALIVMSLIFATSFPFVPGYGTLATFAGYVYGVPLGFTVSVLSALSGACACFIICQKFGRHYTQQLVNSSPHLGAVLKAVSRKGIKLLILVRLAPYPYSLMNALLSLSGISLKTFAIATGVSLAKVITHVIIGANLESLTDALFQHPSPGKIILGIIAMSFGIGVTFYIYRLARRTIDEIDEEAIEHGHLPGEVYPMDSTPWQLGSSDGGEDGDNRNIRRTNKRNSNGGNGNDSQENDNEDDDWGWN
ncbi:snare associated Golgi protein-domain-containing protein [Syncephalis fuscata]|nr:snare associated Golgi protein-domain-containing protein [Syncephalis fuscata]